MLLNGTLGHVTHLLISDFLKLHGLNGLLHLLYLKIIFGLKEPFLKFFFFLSR